jgi:hypothetical protein
VDELGAEFDGVVADALSEDAAADMTAGLQDCYRDAGSGEGARGGEAGHACSDDEDFAGG